MTGWMQQRAFARTLLAEISNEDRIATLRVKTRDGTGTIVKLGGRGVGPRPGVFFVVLDKDADRMGGDALAREFPLNDIEVSDREFGGAGIFRNPSDPMFGGLFST